MTDHAALAAFLTDSLGKCLEYGHFAFHDLHVRLAGHLDQRIIVESMDGHTELAQNDHGFSRVGASGTLSGVSRPHHPPRRMAVEANAP
jgi:hypothetical protein